MKPILYISTLGLVAFMINACSSDNNALSTNECPQNTLCLYTNVSVSQNIMPNAYKANIRITESDTLRKGGEIEPTTKKDIANTLNDIIALSKKSGFCEGGNHDLRPNIQYKDGAARDTVYMNEYMFYINKNKYLSFLAPNVNVIATSESLQEAQDKAFEKALKLAKNKEDEYSKIAGKKCALSSADSLNTHSIQPKFARLETSNMSAYADTSWELPMPKEQEITAKIQVKYICK